MDTTVTAEMSDRSGLVAASIEMAPKQVLESQDLPALFPFGTRVYLPDMGDDALPTLIKAAKRLAELGYVAVPHIAARRVTTRAALEERIKACVEEAGVGDVLVIGGDVRRPSGPFSSSLEVLETSFLDKYGIGRVGIAGHPEGSHDFPDRVALEALRLKQAFGARTGASVRIVTQFGFDPQKFVAWADGLSSHEIDLPIHLGVAGPARITTLLKYATLCGVGNSLNFLKKRSASLASLATTYSPEAFVAAVESLIQGNPVSPIKQIHIFPFGGIKKTAEWIQQRGSWQETR